MALTHFGISVFDVKDVWSKHVLGWFSASHIRTVAIDWREKFCRIVGWGLL